MEWKLYLPEINQVPFVLEAIPEIENPCIGEEIRITYHLTNISDQSFGGCVCGWDSFHFYGPELENRGRITGCTAYSPEDIFYIPPGKTLTWEILAIVPDVGIGEVKFIAILSSQCALWNGIVKSEPVIFHVDCIVDE